MPYNKQKRYSWLLLGFLLILGLLAYSNTFKGEFQFDDDIAVTENAYVQGSAKLSLADLMKSIENGTRPVTTLTFALDYRLGGLDVRWYHITNFLIHLFNGLLIFYLVLLTFNSHTLAGSESSRGFSVALLSSAFFLLHPIQTEAVSYISQRYESLSSLFYLSSLISYIRAVNAEKRYNSVLFYAVSFLGYLLAMGSKEIAVTIPVIILLYDFCFLKERPFLRRIMAPGILIILSSIIGVFIINEFNRGVDAGFSVTAFTPREYLMTQFRAITAYIRLLFLPINQNLDYDFRISKSLLEPDTFLSLIFLLTLSIAAIAMYNKWRIGSFFILWFFIILAPTSSIIPIVDPLVEHRAYLASAGVFIIVSDLLSRVFYLSKDRRAFNRVVFVSIFLLIIVLAVSTFQRNKVWKTKLSLWEDTVKNSPMKSRVHNNLGNSYLLLVRHAEAIEEYKKAVNLNKDNVEAYYNLGIILDKIGLTNQALYYYNVFYEIAPARYDEQKKAIRKRIDILYNRGENIEK